MIATKLQTMGHAISIHAPVKGATCPAGFDTTGGSISIHAPVKGATSIIIRIGAKMDNFNPRSREGSDLARLAQ